MNPPHRPGCHNDFYSLDIATLAWINLTDLTNSTRPRLESRASHPSLFLPVIFTHHLSASKIHPLRPSSFPSSIPSPANMCPSPLIPLFAAAAKRGFSLFHLLTHLNGLTESDPHCSDRWGHGFTAIDDRLFVYAGLDNNGLITPS